MVSSSLSKKTPLDFLKGVLYQSGIFVNYLVLVVCQSGP